MTTLCGEEKAPQRKEGSYYANEGGREGRAWWMELLTSFIKPSHYKLGLKKILMDFTNCFGLTKYFFCTC